MMTSTAGTTMPTSSDADILPTSIAIIGAGPTGVYTLEALRRSGVPCAVTVFEAADQAGPGIPYAAAHNAVDLLANIAGVEIPPLMESLNSWAIRQPDDRLRRLGIAEIAGDDRAFFPRVAIGEWLRDQFDLISADFSAPQKLEVRCSTVVTDVVAGAEGCTVQWQDRSGHCGDDRFDRVVVATGYGRSDCPVDLAGSSVSVPSERRLVIVGTSLSGIDAVVALAQERGHFVGEGAELRYEVSEDWHATMVSRRGLLPEADYWFPVPSEPLRHFTLAAATQLLTGSDGDLDKLFELFTRDLGECDPVYAANIGLHAATPDDFAARYYAERLSSDPFAAARRNLAVARSTHRLKQTSAWRYAILRAHETFADVLPVLTANDLRRFDRGLKSVFIDNYAAVPHLSIERLLALHEAGVLDLKATGPEYLLEQQSDGVWFLQTKSWRRQFDAVVDARGQQAVGLEDIPFPTLRMQICADAASNGRSWADGLNPQNDLALSSDHAALKRVHAIALPFLLKRRPFVQGLVECSAMGQKIALAVAECARTSPPVEPAVEVLNEMIEELDGTTLIYNGSGTVIVLPDRMPSRPPPP